MAHKNPKVNANDKKTNNSLQNRPLGAMSGPRHGQERMPSEVNRPVEVIACLPLARERDQYMTSEWADLIEDCWDQVAPGVERGVVGWFGVHDYNAREKTGNVVICVNFPLDWNDDYKDDAGKRKARVREVFSRALGIDIKEVLVSALPDIKTVRQWKRAIRPFAELPAEVAVLPNEWCETSLFVPVKRGRHRFIRRELLVRREDVEVRMKGEQLDMKDARILMAMIRLVEDQPLQDILDTSWRQLIREAGRER